MILGEEGKSLKAVLTVCFILVLADDFILVNLVCLCTDSAFPERGCIVALKMR